MKIQILIDNKESWIIPFTQKYIDHISTLDMKVTLIHDHNQVEKGDILILLGCLKKFNFLHLNTYNLVVHESDLPKGKGMSPLTWQIIEGKNIIVVSLLEVSDEIDSGIIYDKIEIKLNGTELIDELRVLQSQASFNLINKFITKYPLIQGVEQFGDSTYYRRRDFNDSKIDINQTLSQQFNLLRTLDNERYPGWFEINGEKYILKIYKHHK